jgi:hypothetical protein
VGWRLRGRAQGSKRMVVGKWVREGDWVGIELRGRKMGEG